VIGADQRHDQSACNFAEDVNSERSLKQLRECRSSYLKMGAFHVCIQRFSVLPNLIGEIPSLLLRLIQYFVADDLLQDFLTSRVTILVAAAGGAPFG